MYVCMYVCMYVFMYIKYRGLGIGDWGLGIGPNPQSPIPNPQSPKVTYIEYRINTSILYYLII